LEEGVAEPLTVFLDTKIDGFDPTEFQTEQVFYKSKDGTSIPMFIISKKGVERNGKNPVLLYGYGGFNITMQPSFSSIRLTFMKHLGGVYAMANIRGGGEFGEEWHKAAVKEKKQNCFDDFQAAAIYLVEHSYTSHNLIVIQGGSNGGLLVGACINQRPELFGCGIAQVGVLDMLRYHKFTIGKFWVSDYGCADDAEDFPYLHAYSPIHNVNTTKPYPAVLLTTADHDDRVSPLHSYKYIAQLQSLVGPKLYQSNPLLIRIEEKAGHGAGKPTTKVIDEYTDIMSFFALHLNLKWIN